MEPILRRFLEEHLADLVDKVWIHNDAALATVVAILVRLAPTRAKAAEVVASLPEHSTLLATIAAELQHQSTDHYRALAGANPEAFLPALAGSLNRLSRRLSDLGRREQAREGHRRGRGGLPNPGRGQPRRLPPGPGHVPEQPVDLSVRPGAP